jgi:hypothetical protein
MGREGSSFLCALCSEGPPMRAKLPRRHLASLAPSISPGDVNVAEPCSPRVECGSSGPRNRCHGPWDAPMAIFDIGWLALPYRKFDDVICLERCN